MPDGYGYDPATLNAMPGKLREGASAIDTAIGGGFDSPDAGASSGVVGKAIRSLLTAAAGGASKLDDVAAAIHTANGAYADIDNTNAGAVKRQERQDADQDIQVNGATGPI